MVNVNQAWTRSTPRNGVCAMPPIVLAQPKDSSILFRRFCDRAATGMAGGAGVDGGMRGVADLPEFSDKIGAVVALVGAGREPSGRSG